MTLNTPLISKYTHNALVLEQCSTAFITNATPHKLEYHSTGMNSKKTALKLEQTSMAKKKYYPNLGHEQCLPPAQIPFPKEIQQSKKHFWFKPVLITLFLVMYTFAQNKLIYNSIKWKGDGSNEILAFTLNGNSQLPSTTVHTWPFMFGTDISHHINQPSNDVIYHLNNFNRRVDITFNQCTIQKGHFYIQSSIQIMKLSVYAFQHVMTQHDFKIHIEKATFPAYPQFMDIFCKRARRKTHSKCIKSSLISTPTIIGGGKDMTDRKKSNKTQVRGSTIFQGKFLCQYPCFLVKDKTLMCIFDPQHIIKSSYRFISIRPLCEILETFGESNVICKIPINCVLQKLTAEALSNLSCSKHFGSVSRASILAECERHFSNLDENELYVVFACKTKKVNDSQATSMQNPLPCPPIEPHPVVESQTDIIQNNDCMQSPNTSITFPPPPMTEKDLHKIITNYCNDIQPHNFEEAGCKVCGELTKLTNLHHLDGLCFDYLRSHGHEVTRKERKSAEDPIEPIEGPVLDPHCSKICSNCKMYVEKQKMPVCALANGLWIGDVPDVLKELTFAEQILIAKVRTNRFTVKVESGMRKTRCNIIAFPNPVHLIYDILPPPMTEMNEVFAVILIGCKPPTDNDFEKKPLYMVRRKKVQDALEWLKLNHADYTDLIISHENLNEYPERGSPVPFLYLTPDDITSNKHPESTSVHDPDIEEGVTDGIRVGVMHGLIEKDTPIKSWAKLAGDAIKHLKQGGELLVVGHSDQPESLFKNPTLYAQAFPWLFPYGLGSIENENTIAKISSKAHKQHLLMYHDKRFQTDRLFAIFAFNHEQIKDSSTAGFVLTKQSNFDQICNRITNLNQATLQNILERMDENEVVKPNTEEEWTCFQLLNDLDKVSQHVQGSITSKKKMRNELWSLVSFKGAPSWFITFSPADTYHPLCLYFADTDEKFVPKIRNSNERYTLIAQNPVAGARFFHIMVELFLKHVLGISEDDIGLFGKTSAYYGTVEQQGRLTLHLHLLLWIENSLSPQEVRDRIMDPTSSFQQKMIEYLESAHAAEFIDKNVEEVRQDLEQKGSDESYVEPTLVLPEIPPPFCDCNVSNCASCKLYLDWVSEYKDTVNDMIFRIHRHTCNKNKCQNNKHKMCKARFPRQTFETSMVDPQTGALCMKHKEPFLNSFNHTMTYLQRCNSDSTSLLSGTAVKSIIAYVTDYITKCSLNTHAMFQAIKTVFEKNPHVVGPVGSVADKSRQLLTKLSNYLICKLEIGSPMAAMYLLKNPDHYTSHNFVGFYWKSFVNEAMRTASSQTSVMDEIPEKTVVITQGMKASSPINDYVYRPFKYSNFTLYDWIQQSQKTKGGTRQQKAITKENDKEDIASSTGKNTRKRKREEENEDVFVDLSSMFAEGHPQRETHQPVLLTQEEWKNRVPNFMGGALPRRDVGDAELYAATMLCLFKPWRNGKDLKNEGCLWSETYEKHIFTEQQQKLMDNFNLRYECCDARDDFAAQRRIAMTDKHNLGKLGLSTSQDDLDSLNMQDSQNTTLNLIQSDVDNVDDDENPEQFVIIGEKTAYKLMQMNAIESLLHKVGWTKSCKTTRNAGVPELCGVDTSTDWSNVLKEKRKQILAQRVEVASNNTEPPLTDTTNTTYATQFLNQIKKLVRWTDISYLFRNYSKDESGMVELKDFISNQNGLNEEQERAFKIITNHVTSNTSERLQMYLGGMAGTGKSRVVKAVTEFFKEIQQTGQIALLAPTGTAAAIIGGSTYHSYLGISDNRKLSLSTMAKLREKVERVKYIFIDEVSMISCLDLYRISEQLSLLLNNADEPFGGVNIIFAGDFAQLPPVSRSVSLYGRVHDSSTVVGQKNAIGKALWHQTTTVVILRKNMRQKSQTHDDTLLRTALENMRYKACTSDDIEYLHSLASISRIHQKLNDERFRDVSVITALNVHRDRINELGSNKYAAETGQKLISFYSTDNWPGGTKASSTKRQKTNAATPLLSQHNSRNEISPFMQKVLWDIPPNSTDHHPGVLRLCKGLPVLIKHNEATECCVTNGAEAKIVDWISVCDSQTKKLTLQTIFVELINPPYPVKLDGLPLNVVPISPDTKSISCLLPDGTELRILRSQIPIIPNFAMTDYCSQGRTRPFNIVHLNNCRTHQSYYTCLSRSATHEGTVILNGFNSKTITGGLSGNLRQEFRELEILDDISKLQYEGTLTSEVKGSARREIISQYRRWKGDRHMPQQIHKELEWSDCSPFILSNEENIPWTIVNNKKIIPTKGQSNLPVGHKNLIQYVPAQYEKESISSIVNKPVRVETMNSDTQIEMTPSSQSTFFSNSVSKTPQNAIRDDTRSTSQGQFQLLTPTSQTNTMTMPSHVTQTTHSFCFPPPSPPPQLEHNINLPLTPPYTPPQSVREQMRTLAGMKWDSQDYSCAYDSFFTILWNMWEEDHVTLEDYAAALSNDALQTLLAGFTQHKNGIESLEYVRNKVREKLRMQDIESFPFGRQGVSMTDLLNAMSKAEAPLGTEVTHCTNCGLHPVRTTNIKTSFIVIQHEDLSRSRQIHAIPLLPSQRNTEHCATLLLKGQVMPTPCSACSQKVVSTKMFRNFPKLIILHVGENQIQVLSELILNTQGQICTYKLKGMIYFGQFHFTARFVDSTGDVWYHDGIQTQNTLTYHGNVSSMPALALLHCQGRRLCTIIYATQ